MSYAETVRNIAATCENYAQLDPVPPVALTFVAHGFTAIAEALDREEAMGVRIKRATRCTCGIGAEPPITHYEHCAIHQHDGEARDDLSATVERLYDGIDAALHALTSPSYGESQHAAATRILRNLRPSVPAPTNAEVADEIDEHGHVREVNL